MLFSVHTPTSYSSYSTVMARLITYSLIAFALSGLAIASPLILPRQDFGQGLTITSVTSTTSATTPTITITSTTSAATPTITITSTNSTPVPTTTITSTISSPVPATTITSTISSPVPTTTITSTASIATPTNVAPGTVTAGCSAFHTVAPGETCLLLEEEFNISDALLHALNPEINSGCTNLIAGEAYCVGNATVVPPPPPPSVPPPSNIAPGTITTGCAQYFTVQPGQTCDIIDTMFGITFPEFLLLNPEVNSGCTNVIAGLAYCVQSA